MLYIFLTVWLWLCYLKTINTSFYECNKLKHYIKTLYRTNGDTKVKTPPAVDTSPIASKKSRKRKILDDSSDEEDTTEATVVTNKTNNTGSSGSPSSSSVAATVSDDLPCSSASLQPLPDIMSTPPKRVTGNTCVCLSVCICLSVRVSVCVCLCVCMHACVSVCVSVHLSVYLSMHACVYVY